MSLLFVSVGHAEDWKVPEDNHYYNVGVLSGLGMIDNRVGLSVLGTAAMKLLPQGVIPNISNSIWMEVEIGPVFLSNATALAFAADARWDFVKDHFWTLFAVGGVGGNVLTLNNDRRYELVPRFGVGAFYKISPLVQLRGEIAHDIIGVGLNLLL